MHITYKVNRFKDMGASHLYSFLHDFNKEEFIQLCTTVGSKPYLPPDDPREDDNGGADYIEHVSIKLPGGHIAVCTGDKQVGFRSVHSATSTNDNGDFVAIWVPTKLIDKPNSRGIRDSIG